MTGALIDLAANSEKGSPSPDISDTQFFGRDSYSNALVDFVTTNEQTDMGGGTIIPDPRQFSIVVLDEYEPLTGPATVYFSAPMGIRDWQLNHYLHERILATRSASSTSHQFAGYHVVTPKERPEFPNESEVSEFDSIVDSLPDNHQVTKQKLIKLKSILDEDEDEPDMDLDSLKSLVMFLTDHEDLSVPRMASTGEGYLHIEWPISPDGLVTMQFVGATNVQFMAASPKATGAPTRKTGTSSRIDAFETLRAYFEQIA